MISGLLVLCLVLPSLPSQAQSTRDLLNRLNRVENELETLNRAIYRGEPMPGGDPGMQANVEIRMQQLEVELRDIRGKLEEQAYEIRQMRTQLDRALSDMELRMSDMEGGTGSTTPGRIKTTTPSATSRYTTTRTAPSPPPAPAPAQGEPGFTWNSNPANAQPAAGNQLGTLSQSPTTGAVTASVSDSAAAAYENAFALLKNSQYDAAEREFQSFINRNPDHVLISNAKYWLGETFYVRGDYERAARVFAEGYKLYPQSSKAPDNLLKLGMSLAGLGNTDDACVALGQLEKEYPTGYLPVLRRAKQEMSRLNCV